MLTTAVSFIEFSYTIKYMSTYTEDKNIIIAMDKLCLVFSRALDIIEIEQIGASEHHSMRAAALCATMGRRLGYDDDTISALATCALFHDNALTEYHLSEQESEKQKLNMILHCEKGQSNASSLPFKKDINGFILYHHELGDGGGPFQKKEGEFPFEAALIAAADSVDVTYHLQNVKEKDLPALRDKIAANAEIYSTRAAIDILLDLLDNNMLESLRDDNIADTLDNCLPRWEINMNEPGVINIADFFAHVIDYKSEFTRKHTSQIANRARLMGKHYGYSPHDLNAVYLAAALHDIGKIATPTDILEKQGKLDEREFKIIMDHVRHTNDWLCVIPGFEKIKNWAADHHEKLDGTGYSFGKKSEELDFNSRLIACLDIYQAVSEPRPYHDARPHDQTMPILHNMADNGFIDKKIVKDLDEVMEEYSMKDVPFFQ